MLSLSWREEAESQLRDSELSLRELLMPGISLLRHHSQHQPTYIAANTQGCTAFSVTLKRAVMGVRVFLSMSLPVDRKLEF